MVLKRTGPAGQDTLSAYEPSYRENLIELLAGAMRGMGVDKYRAGTTASNITGLAEWSPLGALTAMDDAQRAAGEGDYAGAALSAVGAVPVAGKAGKAGREALTEVASKGRKAAITAQSLRGLPLDEAIKIAQSERHIIPAGKGGKTSFVGAPYAATDRSAIEQLRAKFDADVGAGAEGADWYQRVQDWIKETAGPDPAKQSELARNLALFSAQADPSGNLGFSVKARNNAIMGMEPEGGVVRTGQQWQTYKDALNSGEPIKLGQKTGVYAGHMDPTVSNPTTGTNDIWHARALGYGEPEIVGGLGPQRHAWMDAETVLAVDRANKAGIGGRYDWSPGEVQAAPWVAGKGRGLAERRKGMTVEQGIAEASKTYPDYAPAFTAYGTHEMTPGRQTGHLPGIAGGDQATRDAFAQEPGSWWQDPQGHDALYRAQGAYTAPSERATGVYGDPVQFNPMEAARPLVAFSGATGERVLDPASRQMLTGTEGFRAYMDAQDMGGFSIPIPGQKASHNDAFELALGGGNPSREELAAIMQAGAGSDQGMGDLIHYGGPRAALTQFEPGKTGIGAKETKAMNEALGGRATATPTKLDSGGVFYEGAWRGGAPSGAAPVQGTDMATTEMLSQLNAAQEAALDKPEVRQKVLERFDRDARVALERGDVVRDDIQRARKLFAEGGFKALRENLGKGLLPAAAAGIFLTRQDDEAA